MASGQILEGEILEGPSKFDLMAALFDGKKVQFTFKLGEVTHKVNMGVSGVAAEDGSRESWLINGFFPTGLIHGPCTFSNFSGYFETRRRKGHITVGTKHLSINA